MAGGEAAERSFPHLTQSVIAPGTSHPPDWRQPARRLYTRRRAVVPRASTFFGLHPRKVGLRARFFRFWTPPAMAEVLHKASVAERAARVAEPLVQAEGFELVRSEE